MSDIKKDNESIKDKKYWEARQNLFGFFSLLLEVDMRVNPHLYKKQMEEKEDNENINNPNA